MTAPKQVPVSRDMPRHRERMPASSGSSARCTCQPIQLACCARHYPSLYAAMFAKHRAAVAS